MLLSNEIITNSDTHAGPEPDNAMTTPTTRPLHSVYKLIHPVFARFTDPATEREFLDHVAGETRRHLVIAFLVWAALILVFAVPDYADLGAGPEFAAMFAMRAASAVMILGYALACLRWRNLAHNFPAISLIVIVAMTGFVLIYFLRPDVVGFVIGVTMVMIVGAYLLIPNLLSWNTLVISYIIATSLLSVWLTHGTSAAGLASLFVIYLLPALTGFFIAHRLQLLRRGQFALLLEAEQRNQELEREVERRKALEQELEQQAATDPLTGLHNRRGYELLFEQELKRAQRLNAPLSVAILDLDRFKNLNDTYGHGAGDQVLKSLAREWSQRLRGPDILGRLGGEEFVVLMPDTAAPEAAEVMERLRRHTESVPRELGVATVAVTVTIGVTDLDAADDSFQDMIARADEALYRGKDQGRNQVVILRAGEPGTTPPGETAATFPAPASSDPE